MTKDELPDNIECVEFTDDYLFGRNAPFDPVGYYLTDIGWTLQEPTNITAEPQQKSEDEDLLLEIAVNLEYLAGLMELGFANTTKENVDVISNDEKTDTK